MKTGGGLCRELARERKQDEHWLMNAPVTHSEHCLTVGHYQRQKGRSQLMLCRPKEEEQNGHRSNYILQFSWVSDGKNTASRDFYLLVMDLSWDNAFIRKTQTTQVLLKLRLRFSATPSQTQCRKQGMENSANSNHPSPPKQILPVIDSFLSANQTKFGKQVFQG